ncbi:MAG: glycosyltransferase family 4 protein [Chloroflexi bacterium]|nr:MAG: glycosyltransferase family 4 protein [Chloroflexota bacterium]
MTSVPASASVLRLPPAALAPDPCYEPVIRLPLPGSRDRIRVVELLATGTSGGAQEHLYNLVTRLDRARYDVSVLALSGGPGVRRIERTGVPVCVLDDMSDDAAVAAVASHLAAVDADVVHNHMYRAEVVGTQAAWSLAHAGRRRPFVVGTVHSSRIRSEEDRDLLRRLTPRMDHLIAVSRAIVRKLEDEGRVGAPISLIYNGVDLARYSEQAACPTLLDEYGIAPDAPIVGVVARLEPEKGHPTLLDAWPAVLAAVPNAHLLVVGEGSQRDLLEAQAASLGLLEARPAAAVLARPAAGVLAQSAPHRSPAREFDAHPRITGMPQLASISAARDGMPSVTFTGRRDDVPAVTAALDVAVLPSYREAQGLSILEAMALSRPVVASAVGGIPEMIDDNRTGLLVPPRDSAALAAAIVRLLTHHAFAAEIGRAGHDLVHERFCVEQMVRAVETIYDEAVADERRLAAG